MTETVLPPRVLFVDDDRSMRIALANAARSLGIEAVVADSGGQALELAQQASFPVVVTDLKMPGIDGTALVERLSTLHPSTAFVLVTAETEFDRGLAGRGAGAVASLLHKPLSVAELRATLTQAFALHRRRAARHDPISPQDLAVLLVEDSPGDTELLREYLEGQPGITLFHVPRLQAALRVLHERKFDAIITDLSLPDARGFDTVLRLQVGAPEAAILVYSGLTDEALALQVLQVGAQDFLPKATTNASALLRALRFAGERKRAELRLRRLAHYAQLTGLANRVWFDQALGMAFARAERQQTSLAVMIIDLDGFKPVNDTHGHEAGDLVLQEVGVRLRCLFREYDVIARLGGDEFAVLVTDVDRPQSLCEMARRLIDAVGQPIGPTGSRVTASVGIAMFPDGGTTPARLIRSADAAMYASKRAGRDRFTFFEGPVPPSSGRERSGADASGLIALEGEMLGLAAGDDSRR